MKDIEASRAKIEALIARRRKLQNMMTCREVRSALHQNTLDLSHATGFDFGTCERIYRSRP